MDEDDEDPGDFDEANLLDDASDAMFQDGQVVMPDGSLMCLCDRDPGSDDVMTEIAKAAALIVEYDLFLDGCVIEAAAAFDTIYRDLKTEPARRLRRSMSNARTIVETHVLTLHDADGPIVPGSRVPH